MFSRRTSSASLKEQNASSLLHSSIIKGNKSTLQEAFKLGCNLKDRSKFGDPPLVAAAGIDPMTTYDHQNGRDKMLEIMELLLSREDCDINGRGSGGDTALHKATVARSAARVQILLERGCDVDIRNSRGQTPLFPAVTFVEGLDLLLKYKPQLDVYDLEGYTPLMHAIMSESPVTVQTCTDLVRAGCDINAVKRPENYTLLMVRLNNGPIPRSEQRLEKTSLLLAYGAEIDAQDMDGCSVLHHGIKCGCVDLIKRLLKCNANVDLQNNQRLNAIEIAKSSVHQNEEIIRLIERASDKSSRLLPYEQGLSALEALYTAVAHDEEIPIENKHYLKSQIDKLQTTIQEVISLGRGAESMALEDKRVLAAKQEILSDEMMPHLILSELQQKKVLSSDDVTTIKAEKARKPMSVRLLTLLPHRGPHAFDALMRALKRSKQNHVCDILRPSENTQL